MGGGNPVKRLLDDGSDIVHNPAREIARAVGADGLVDKIDGFKDKHNAFDKGLVDKVSGKESKMKKERDANNAKIAAANKASEEMQAKQAGLAAEKKIEDARMAGDSATRTLLTGGTGLEDDEEESISRRTLRGF